MMYSTLPVVIDIELTLIFPVKDFVSLYTYYVRYVGHKQHHINVTDI